MDRYETARETLKVIFDSYERDDFEDVTEILSYIDPLEREILTYKFVSNISTKYNMGIIKRTNELYLTDKEIDTQEENLSEEEVVEHILKIAKWKLEKRNEKKPKEIKKKIIKNCLEVLKLY